jgi:hypothetical protein
MSTNQGRYNRKGALGRYSGGTFEPKVELQSKKSRL